MSVVRLELVVPDDDARDVADRLIAGYHGLLGDVPRAHVTVEIRTEEEAMREREARQAARKAAG